MEEHRYDPFDRDYVEDLEREILRDLLGTYFRPRLLGAHRLPAEGPAILAPNHSGNAFPYDAMVLDALLWRRGGRDRKIRSVFERELASTWWMRPFGIDNFWRRGGGVDLTFENFDRLLARGERVLYYPEGVPGIGKGFFKRYQLQRFSTSFVIMAARHEAPVVPIYILNAEWSVPFNFTWKPVDWLMQKLFGVPFLPLPAGPLAMVFPWAWYLGLPTRLIFVVGEPLDVASMVRETGETDLETPDRTKMRQVANEVQRHCQEELSRLVERRARWPYQRRLLARRLREHRKRGGKLWRVLPLAWPVVFVSHHRDRMRAPARGRLHRWLRDWDLLGFYLPFGWLFLSLTRRFRRPPCGYRGMAPEVARRVQGEFLWKLDERPLPEPLSSRSKPGSPR